MAGELVDRMARAAAAARRHAEAFPGSTARDDLPWAVIAAFDAEIRGSVARDRRIEEERDRVLIASVNLAEALPDDIVDARTDLIDAIDYLEQAVVRFGIPTPKGARDRGPA